jgi:prevent-host-death family protein
MTGSVGVHEAKTHLSGLLEEVAAGGEVMNTRRGEEVASLVPVRRSSARRFGLDRGDSLCRRTLTSHFRMRCSRPSSVEDSARHASALLEVPVLTADPSIAQYPVHTLTIR